MVPLRLELNEETAVQLHDIPAAIRDDIEQYHNKLLSQVVKFYYQKRNELEQYARQKIYETRGDVAGPDTKEESDRKLKSIVKRRPSKIDKRVSFSKSPPHVEHFRKYDEDEEALESFDEPREFSDLLQQGAVSPKPPKSVPPVPYQIAVPQITPCIPKASTASTGAGEPPRDEAGATEDDLFAFEDVIESSPSTSDNTVLMHSSRDSSSSSLRGSDSESDSRSSISSLGEAEPREAELIQQFSVGSAPLDIRPNPNKLEYDGGPPQKTESLQKEETLEDASLYTSGSLSDQATIDPSNMSFSQRIEWERNRGDK